MKNRKFFSRDFKKQKEVLKNAKFLFTTSNKEEELIKNDFKIKNVNFISIPCGIDPEVFVLNPKISFSEKYKIKNYFLCVGRIEDLKNQLSLIRFFKKTNVKLVLIGGKNNKQLSYYQQCKKEASESENIIMIDYLGQEIIASAYSSAIALIAPSWFETFGLVSLEAIACGAQVITTKNSPLSEYFGDNIYYCDPVDLGNTLKKAMESIAITNRNVSRDYIINNFSWKKLAKNTHEVYKQVLKKSDA